MVNVREADISVIKALKCFRAGQPSAWPMSLCSLHYLSGDWLVWATPSALPSSRAAGLAGPGPAPRRQGGPPPWSGCQGCRTVSNIIYLPNFLLPSFFPGNWTKSWAQQQDAIVGLNHLQLQLWELGRALAKRSPIKLGQFSTLGLGSLSWFLFHFPGAPRELGLLSPCHIATPEKSLTPLLVL